MRKLLFFAIIFCVLNAAPVFAGQFGPAQAQVRPGQFALGAGAFRYSDNWDFSKFSSDAVQTQLFIQGELGLFPNWETYLRLGAANLDVDGILGGSDFRDDFVPYATLGLKGLIHRGKYLDFGGFVEGSYFDEYTDESSTAKVIIDQGIAMNAGVTFQKELEGALLYGGPFFHFREGDFWFVSKNAPAKSFSSTYEENQNFGGFLGIRWVAYKDIVVETEFQLRENLSAGAALSFLF